MKEQKMQVFIEIYAAWHTRARCLFLRKQACIALEYGV